MLGCTTYVCFFYSKLLENLLLVFSQETTERHYNLATREKALRFSEILDTVLADDELESQMKKMVGMDNESEVAEVGGSDQNELRSTQKTKKKIKEGEGEDLKLKKKKSKKSY